VQLDGGTLGVEPEPRLTLLVGADAIVGDERADDETKLPIWIVVPTLPPLPCPVQTVQTDVCNVRRARNGAPERGAEQDEGQGALTFPAERFDKVRFDAGLPSTSMFYFVRVKC